LADIEREQRSHLLEHPDELSLGRLLLRANPDELAGLAAILGERNCAVRSLTEALLKKSRSKLGSLFANRRPTYSDALDVVGDACELQRENLTDPEFERALVDTIYVRALSEMSEDARREVISQAADLLHSSSSRNYKKELIVGGGLAAAQASGFGVYMAASTALAATTSAVGITLPFAAYTGLAKVVSVAIGPIGWAALATWLVIKSDTPDIKRLTPSVLQVASVRARLLWEWETKRDDLANRSKEGRQLLEKIESIRDQGSLDAFDELEQIQHRIERGR